MKARLQYRPDGERLGIAIFFPAEIIEAFVADGADEIEFEVIRMPSGIHIDIGG